LKQPADHGVVQKGTQAFSFLVWIYEQGPDVARRLVSYSKTENDTVFLSDPATSGFRDGGDVVLLGDYRGGEAILTNGQAHAMHARDVGFNCYANNNGHSVLPNVGGEEGPTAGRQARTGENVPRTTSPGLVACRWASPRPTG